MRDVVGMTNFQERKTCKYIHSIRIHLLKTKEKRKNNLAPTVVMPRNKYDTT
jgi:hypothetical protein